MLHDRLGEEVREVEGWVVEARELEVEQPDGAVIEHEHVAVVGVVVAEDRLSAWETCEHFLRGLRGVDRLEICTHLLLVDGKRRALVDQCAAGQRTPVIGEEFEERRVRKTVGL